MRGLRLQLTRQQATDLRQILGFEITVPRAIHAKIKAWGGKGLPQAEQERLSASMNVLFEKVSNL